jgi:hypothetical protein
LKLDWNLNEIADDRGLKTLRLANYGGCDGKLLGWFRRCDVLREANDEGSEVEAFYLLQKLYSALKNL